MSDNTSTNPPGLQLTPNDFLNAVFTQRSVGNDEAVLVSWPDSFTDPNGRTVNYHKQKAWHPRARCLFPEGAGWLYCVSTVRRADKLKRRKEDVSRAFVLVCDDVGTKAKVPPVRPSYILETSPGNFQYGYLLEPVYVGEPERAALYDACLMGLAKAGYNDVGCRSATRVVKLPGATHRTGFVSRLTLWEPDRTWFLEDLMTGMGVEPDAAIARGAYRYRQRPGKHQRIEEVYDPIYDWLCETGRVLNVREEWVHVECPWVHLHSEGTSREAGYTPLDFIKGGRGFKCFHGHGHQHGWQEFLAWVVEQGGPSLSMTFENIKDALNVQD